METRKQRVGSAARRGGREILTSVAKLLLATACLLILFLSQKSKDEPNKAPATAGTFDNPLGLVLTPQTGKSHTDKEISQLQQRIREGRNVELWLDRLGWRFVAKARESFDPGFYKLAEQCARSIEMR